MPLTSSIALKDEDSLHTADESQHSAGAAPLGSRGIVAPAKLASLAGVSRVQEVRGSLPCLRAQEGLPRCHRMPCGGSIGRSNCTAPYPALLPALNGGVSAPEVIDDRKLPPAAGPYPPIHPRRAARVRGLPGRRPGHVPAQQERHRPADLPVVLRRRRRDRTAGRRSRRPQPLRRRGSAAGGEEAPGTGPRAGRWHRVVRRRRGRADGRLQLGGPGLRGGPRRRWR